MSRGVISHADVLIDEAGPLDNAALYEGGWSRVVLRIPELCDVVRVPSDADFERLEREVYGYDTSPWKEVQQVSVWQRTGCLVQ